MHKPDPAAIFCATRSIVEAWEGHPDSRKGFDAYGGKDGFFRAAGALALNFEQWACANVDFDNFGEVWPYYLEDNFGPLILHLCQYDGLEKVVIDFRQLCFTLKIPVRTETISKQEMIRAAVRTAKDQIRADMSNWPDAKIPTFAALHAYTDANLYGGAEFLIALLGLDGAIEILNPMQEELDVWIQAGCPEDKAREEI